jgi:hypothetical protein
VMSLMGDHDIEQGQEGESEVFSPYGMLIAVGLRRFRRDRTASSTTDSVRLSCLGGIFNG